MVVEGDNISNFQFLARMKALHLETMGFRQRGQSMLAVCRKAYGYTEKRKLTLLTHMEKDWEHFKTTGEIQWQNTAS